VPLLTYALVDINPADVVAITYTENIRNPINT